MSRATQRWNEQGGALVLMRIHGEQIMKTFFSRLAVFFGCALMLSSKCLSGQSGPAADLIIQHARIWTVDSSRSEAEAVAILGDRIVAVGSNQEIEAWHGPHTRVIDADRKRLLPGFNDAHVHFVDGGSQLMRWI